MNETGRQPSISLGLARVYLNATDTKLATRIWQEVMEHLVAKKKDNTRVRWDTAIKGKKFDCIRNISIGFLYRFISGLFSGFNPAILWLEEWLLTKMF